jgi:hypothetical protein
MCGDTKSKRIKHELERTAKGLRSIHVEEARRKTKEDFKFFIDKAHDKDIQAEIALKRHRIDQKYYADIIKADHRCRKIADEFHADRNDTEGYLRDLKRSTDKYQGLGSRGFDVCRSGRCDTDQYHDDYYEKYYDTEYYDEDGKCYNENAHNRTRSDFHNPLEGIPQSTVFFHGTDKRFMQDLHKMEKHKQRKNRHQPNSR